MRGWRGERGPCRACGVECVIDHKGETDHRCPHGDVCGGLIRRAPCCVRIIAAQAAEDPCVVWNGTISRKTGLQPADVGRDLSRSEWTAQSVRRRMAVA